jgi:hypothetical protein
MKSTKFFQRVLIAVLIGVNLTLLLMMYRIDFQEILLFNFSLGLLYMALKNAVELVRSNGLQEQLDEQI